MGEAKLKRSGAKVGRVGFKNLGRRDEWSATAVAIEKRNAAIERERMRGRVARPHAR